MVEERGGEDLYRELKRKAMGYRARKVKRNREFKEREKGVKEERRKKD